MNPSCRVELAIDCLDLIASVLRPIGNIRLRADFEYVYALDLLWALFRNPAKEDVVACVPDIQNGEWNARLAALQSNALCFGAEREVSELAIVIRTRSVRGTIDKGHYVQVQEIEYHRQPKSWRCPIGR